ncbi:MAG: MBL fold metallo-hydrolase [Hyphomicrobiales bacterium]|nr:MBL fold metallo-hydrolase [Hyphomicrobiales bacterium]
MRLRFIGCGDAFGSGGRFNTCFLVDDDHGRFLIDFGVTSLVALKKAGIDPNSIDAIFVTHLHGDHFGGLPFFLMDGGYCSRRKAPLTIAGPPGIKARLPILADALFPDSHTTEWRFDFELVEMAVGQVNEIAGRRVTPVEVDHPVGDTPPTALRIETSGKVLAYTGDTQWTDAILQASRDSDLFICECYYDDLRDNGKHMNWPTVSANMDRLATRRLVLTHMGPTMLAKVGGLGVEYAEDDKVIEL